MLNWSNHAFTASKLLSVYHVGAKCKEVNSVYLEKHMQHNTIGGEVFTQRSKLQPSFSRVPYVTGLTFLSFFHPNWKFSCKDLPYYTDQENWSCEVNYFRFELRDHGLNVKLPCHYTIRHCYLLKQDQVTLLIHINLGIPGARTHIICCSDITLTLVTRSRMCTQRFPVKCKLTTFGDVPPVWVCFPRRQQSTGANEILDCCATEVGIAFPANIWYAELTQNFSFSRSHDLDTIRKDSVLFC